MAVAGMFRGSRAARLLSMALAAALSGAGGGGLAAGPRAEASRRAGSEHSDGRRWGPAPGPPRIDTPETRRSRRRTAAVRPALQRALEARRLHFGAPVYIRIFKAEAELEVWVARSERYELFRTYEICALSQRPGPKVARSDGKSPEGFYRVRPRSLAPWSDYHLAMNVGYPNAWDRQNGHDGAGLMIHGRCVTAGCFAMRDGPVEEIYTLVDAALSRGQREVPVHIFPFRFTDALMRAHLRSPWLDFWRQLRPGYDLFERTKRPPRVVVRRGRYLVAEGRR